MNKNYRGDTFWRSYEVEYENEPYTFKEGDYIIVAFCDYAGNRHLEKKIGATVDSTKVDVVWSRDEMATLDDRQYVLEVEVSTIDFRKTYQEQIDIYEDYIVAETTGDE